MSTTHKHKRENAQQFTCFKKMKITSEQLVCRLTVNTICDFKFSWLCESFRSIKLFAGAFIYICAFWPSILVCDPGLGVYFQIALARSSAVL